MALWGNNDSVSVSGTVTITQNADGVTGNVVGSSTSFDTTTKVGNYLVAGGNTYVVTTIGNSTFMTIKSGKNGINVVAQSGGTSYNIQQAPAFVPLSESSDHAADGIIQGNAELVYGVDSTEMVVANASIVAYTVISAGSGYFSNATVTVGGNGTANAQANSTGRIAAVNVVLSGNSYTSTPSVTIAAPAAQAFNANTGVAANGFISIASNKFQVNDYVTYAVAAGNTVVTGLTSGAKYYVVAANTTGVYLSAGKGGAAITLTPSTVSETGHTLQGETATAAAVLSGAKAGAAHAGWVRRVVGTGGRAGRIQEETLVAMGSIAGDFEDTVMKDA